MVLPIKTLSILIFLSTRFLRAENLPSIEIDENLLRHSPFYGIAAAAAQDNSDFACKNQLVAIAEGLRNRKKWAIKLLDASGTPTSGLQWGATFWLGSRYQCEDTAVLKNIPISSSIGSVTEETIEDLPPFPVSYYAAYFNHNSDIQVITHEKNEFLIILGLCLPKSCDTYILKTLLQSYFDINVFNHQSVYNTTYHVDRVKKIDGDLSWMWNISSIITGLALFIIILLCIFGTLYDVIYYLPLSNQTETADAVKQINLPLSHKILKCFSIYTNFKIIFNIKTSPNDIRCIHGMRFYATLMVCIIHVPFFMKELYDNRLNLFHNHGIFSGALYYLSLFSIEISLCIGGYIMAYSFFKTEYEKSNENVGFGESVKLFITMIFKRYVRLTPTYLIFIGLNLAVSDWLSNNSPFLLPVPNDVTCANYWWRNIFYVHNLYSQHEVCMFWTWYLSNDMQYFILISFLLILSRKYFHTAAGILLFILFRSLIYIRYLVYSNGYMPFLDEQRVMTEEFHFNPIIRISSYIIGVIAAYFVYHRKNDFVINKQISRIIWIVCISINAYFILNIVHYDIDIDFSVLFMTFSKISWAITTAWAIIACETGNGGFIGDILSWKYFAPFSHIAYVVQLLNPIVIYIIGFSTEVPSRLNYPYMIPVVIGYTVIIYLIAFVMTVTIELPNAMLNRTLLSSSQKTKNSKKDKIK